MECLYVEKMIFLLHIWDSARSSKWRGGEHENNQLAPDFSNSHSLFVCFLLNGEGEKGELWSWKNRWMVRHCNGHPSLEGGCMSHSVNIWAIISGRMISPKEKVKNLIKIALHLCWWINCPGLSTHTEN